MTTSQGSWPELLDFRNTFRLHPRITSRSCRLRPLNQPRPQPGSGQYEAPHPKVSLAAERVQGFESYEENKIDRLGPEAAAPHRATHRRLTRD